MYASYDQFFNPLPVQAPVYILDDSLTISLVTYVLNGWPVSQPKNK